MRMRHPLDFVVRIGESSSPKLVSEAVDGELEVYGVGSAPLELQAPILGVPYSQRPISDDLGFASAVTPAVRADTTSWPSFTGAVRAFSSFLQR
jgi:hypothetical protein